MDLIYTKGSKLLIVKKKEVKKNYMRENTCVGEKERWVPYLPSTGVWWVPPALTDGDRKYPSPNPGTVVKRWGAGFVLVSVAWCPVSSNGTSVRSF